MMRILVVVAVLLAVGVTIFALLTVGWQQDIDLSQTPTETINEILAKENTSVGQKQRALDALAQRTTEEALQSIIRFINDTDDRNETDRLLKIRAIDLLVSNNSPGHIRATADLLKTQAHPEIRQHMMQLLGDTELGKDSALALADALSNIRSRDALLVMTNRLAVDKDEKVRKLITGILKSSVTIHLLPRLKHLAEATASDSERQEIENIISSIERNAAQSKRTAAIYKEKSPEALKSVLEQEKNGGIILLALQRLEKIGSPEAVQAIGYFLRERELPPKLRYLYRNAMASLCRVESDESLKETRDLFEHPPTENTRKHIIGFLGDFAKKKESLDFLKQLVQQNMPIELRQAAQQAIKEIEKRFK
jgi:hypothetical protein